MAGGRESLRAMVEHWRNADSSTPVRVARYRSAWANPQSCVQVEAMKPQGPVTMYFFRHEDGRWRVFPPRKELSTMRGR
jgi:hypothetical protein